MRKRKELLRMLYSLLIVVSALLVGTKQSRADVSVAVTHSGPDYVNVGDSLSSIVFAANVVGKPNGNNECEIKNLSYSWTLTVTGSDAGVRTYNSTGPSASAPHMANELCQSYSISASCTVSYNTTPECGVVESNATNADSARVAVEGTPCG